MIRKIVFYLSIFLCLILNFVLDININNYISILENCFNRNLAINNFYYALICFIIALISILTILSIKLVVFYKNEEIKGTNLKSEDGTFRNSKLVR